MLKIFEIFEKVKRLELENGELLNRVKKLETLNETVDKLTRDVRELNHLVDLLKNSVEVLEFERDSNGGRYEIKHINRLFPHSTVKLRDPYYLVRWVSKADGKVKEDHIAAERFDHEVITIAGDKYIEIRTGLYHTRPDEVWTVVNDRLEKVDMDLYIKANYEGDGK